MLNLCIENIFSRSLVFLVAMSPMARGLPDLFSMRPTRRAAHEMVAGLCQGQQEHVSKTGAGVCLSPTLGSGALAFSSLGVCAA